MLPWAPLPPMPAPPPALGPRKRFIVQAGSEAREAWFWLARCAASETHLPPGFASGAGFLFRLHWAGAEFGPALWLGRIETLWTPGRLELPNSNPSITGIQIQTRAQCEREPMIGAKSWVRSQQCFSHINNPAANLGISQSAEPIQRIKKCYVLSTLKYFKVMALFE